MYDVSNMKTRMTAIKDIAEAGGIRALGALDLETLRSVLETAFQEVGFDLA